MKIKKDKNQDKNFFRKINDEKENERNNYILNNNQNLFIFESDNTEK